MELDKGHIQKQDQDHFKGFVSTM